MTIPANTFKRFTETRTTSGVLIHPASHFFFDGPGHRRANINDGRPQVLLAKRAPRNISGRIPGVVKVTAIAHAPGWFSLRSIGVKPSARLTVYVTAETTLVIDGVETTLGAVWSALDAFVY